MPARTVSVEHHVEPRNREDRRYPAAYVGAAGLAAHWQVTRQHIYSLMHQGLPSVKIGRARRFDLARADAWLYEQQDGQ